MNKDLRQFPHIIIDCMSGGIGDVLNKCLDAPQKPIIWLTRTGHTHGNAKGVLDKFERRVIRRDILFGHEASKPELSLTHCLNAAREHHKLPARSPLNIAVYGTHGSTYTYLTAEPTVGVEGVPLEQVEALKQFNSNRSMMTELHSVLTRQEGVIPTWLKHSYPGFPCDCNPPDDMKMLAIQIRDKLSLDFKSVGLINSLPKIFYRKQLYDIKNPSWHLWVPPNKTHPPRSITKLLEAFGDSSVQKDPEKKFVITKLLHSDLRKQNPFDTPILKASAQEEIATMGIHTVLWDRRVGIIAPPEEGAETPKIFCI